MSNDQVVGAIVAFVIANGATVYGIARWGISRAIEYTHLVRDVRELRADLDRLEAKHEKVQYDLKGIASIAKKNNPPTNG